MGPHRRRRAEGSGDEREDAEDRAGPQEEGEGVVVPKPVKVPAPGRKSTTRPSQHGDKERKKLRMAEAFKLKLEGYGPTDIARKLGSEKTTICHDIREVLDELEAVTEWRAKRVRTMELARLDRMLKSLWPAIDVGDVQAINAGIKISESRRRLMGVDLSPEPTPQVNLNVLSINDPKMQVILQSSDALELLHRITEGANGPTNGEGGGNGLAAVARDNGGEAQPELPPLPARPAD